MKKEFTRIAIKVGSNVLTRQDGTLELLPRDEAKYVPSGSSIA